MCRVGGWRSAMAGDSAVKTAASDAKSALLRTQSIISPRRRTLHPQLRLPVVGCPFSLFAAGDLGAIVGEAYCR